VIGPDLGKWPRFFFEADNVAQGALVDLGKP
jgi:hypothetical protein